MGSLRYFLIVSLAVVLGSGDTLGAGTQPNIVIILCDNLGNGDVACFYPGTKHRTPNLDRMAAEGRRFTSFYSASSVCTPSRAALMTGCYPRRVGLHISAIGASVLQPVASRGINPKEETLAELLKRAGYVTACIGKWHLGDQPEFLPTRHGFDSYFGIPYSEDMERNDERGWPELPLLRDEKVIEAPVDAQHLTRRLTEEAVKFIAANKDRPFFLYFPEAAPGSRNVCYPGPVFRGQSANGLYGDAIEELDWSAGEVLKALKQHGLDEKTIVIWTSDNGAPHRNPPQGSNAPYKGWGYTTAEGGQRVPCIIRWPGKVPAGTVCDELCTMMDLLPTLTKLAGAPQPKLKIDGHDIAPLLFGEPGAQSPYDEIGFFYYQVTQLQAVRAGPWKLYLPLEHRRAHGSPQKTGKPQPQPLALYDVRNDVSEQHEVSAQHPDIVAKLTAMAEKARAELGDGERRGKGQRDGGHVENPKPLLLAP
jgi:arylsulfatase A-like enzyme